MKSLGLLLSILLIRAGVYGQINTDYNIQGVPFTSVALHDHFWLPKVEINRSVTIPSSFKKCEETGRVRNFVLAAKKTGKFQTTYPFDDTDVYKIIEGASYSMAVHPDATLDRYVDSLVTIIAQAQEPDGYLYTARTINPQEVHKWAGKERWVNESLISHELYNSGHLFEAAVAHYTATGKRNLLDVAVKNANLLDSVFGPGKRNDAPGHEIVEMGLVRLYRVTGERKYLNLAKFFIDCRGKKIDSTRTYWQDHMPIVQQEEAVGHAVRAGYLYSGVADVAALTGDKEYLRAIDKIWENVVSKKFYITGGVGAEGDGERFAGNYELPNLTAYNETCAAIANVYWNYRMFLLHGDSKYIDVLERSLYNTVVAGVGMDGKSFFYSNPLECDGIYKFNSDNSLTRQPWFNCSCCPTNLCRFLPSISGYIYAQKENRLYVNLFVESSARIQLANSASVELSQQTQYPWDGSVNIRVNPATKSAFAVLLRIPGWVRNQPVPSDLYSYISPLNEPISITVDGRPVEYAIENGYAVINRQWERDDRIELVLPMNIHRVEANKNVPADRGMVALERGPIVFCLEGTDNRQLDSLTLPDIAALRVEKRNDLLGGVTIITGDVPVNHRQTTVTMTAIPYFAWSNREAGTMKVWLARK